jgi:iron(III) transport system permease protein
MRLTKRRIDSWDIITLVVFSFMLIFIVIPLFSLLLKGFRSTSGKFTFEHYVTFFTQKYYYRTLLNSVMVTLSVTITTILIGVPLAYFMNCYIIKGRRFVEILIILSMMSPNFIGAYSWILLLGSNGIVTRFFSQLLGISVPTIYGFKGILLVFTLKLFPFIYLYVSGAIKNIDASLIEAGSSLGVHGIKKITSIILPLIKPTIFAAGLMVFMASMADFGTPMLIGRGFTTMPVLIYNEYVGEMGSQANFASAIATMTVLITGLIFLLQKYYINRKSFVMSALYPLQREKATGVKNVFMHLYSYTVVLLSTLPLLTVIYTSFLKTNKSLFIGGFWLGSYKAVLHNMGRAIRNTYVFGIIGIILIIVLSVLIAYLTLRRKNILTSIIDSLVMVPYIIQGSVLGITYLLVFNKKPLLLSGTAAIVIIAMVIRRMQHAVRTSTSILYQISPSLEEASISLGDTPIRSFIKITARLMIPGVVSGALLSWISIINELSASVILYSTKTRTMAIAIYTEVLRGNYGTAAALATILTLTTLIAMLLFFRITRDKDITW